MKLYYSKTSPFARKVLINAIEAGVIEQIELVDLGQTGQFLLPAHFHFINPLYKVPALEINSNEILIDSPVICEYIDSLAIDKGRKLLPTQTSERFLQHKFQSLADGLLDAALLRRYETARPSHLQSLEFSQKQKMKVDSALNFFESHVYQLTNPYLIGEVALMCALGYLDFRFKNEDWRSENPRLSDWYSKASQWFPFLQTPPT